MIINFFIFVVLDATHITYYNIIDRITWKRLITSSKKERQFFYFHKKSLKGGITSEDAINI